jgi:hypothetical protein
MLPPIQLAIISILFEDVCGEIRWKITLAIQELFGSIILKWSLKRKTITL